MSPSASSRCLVDANLMTLLVVGRSGSAFISDFKRTNQYTPTDFERLSDLLKESAGIVSTPNVLTEVSNLLNPAKGPMRVAFYLALRELIDQIEEVYIRSHEVSGLPSFIDFGLADLGISESAQQTEAVVLTDDLRLAGELASQNIHVLNFNRLR